MSLDARCFVVTLLAVGLVGSGCGGETGSDAGPTDGGPDGGVTDADAAAPAPYALDWAVRAGGFQPDVSSSVSPFDDGSAIVAGSFFGDATFGPGEAAETILTSSGGADIFVARFDPDGALAWATRAGGPDNERALDVVTFDDGSAVIVGRFFGTATFGAGPGSTVLTSAGGNDVFVARLDPDGSFAWARPAGGSGQDAALALLPSSGGAVVVLGTYLEAATFGAGEPNETTLSAPMGFSGLFVARFDTGGALVWARRVAEGDIALAPDAAVILSDGAMLATGTVGPMSTFDPGGANETTYNPVPPTALSFVVRLEPDGTVGWVRTAAFDASRTPSALVAFDDGSSVAAGAFNGSATFGIGEPDETTIDAPATVDCCAVYLARYESDGTLAWARAEAGTVDLVGSPSLPGCAALPDGSVLVAGGFKGSVTFGIGDDAETVLTTADDPELFLARHGDDGTLVWVRSMAAPMMVPQLRVAAALLADEALLLTGEMWTSTTFGAGDPDETVLTADGAGDVFLVRMTP